MSIASASVVENWIVKNTVDGKRVLVVDIDDNTLVTNNVIVFLQSDISKRIPRTGKAESTIESLREMEQESEAVCSAWFDRYYLQKALDSLEGDSVMITLYKYVTGHIVDVSTETTHALIRSLDPEKMDSNVKTLYEAVTA